MKFCGFIRSGHTYAIQFYDSVKNNLNQYFIQLSFKKPWWKPHKEYMYGNDSWCAGVGFIYVGNIIANKSK